MSKDTDIENSPKELAEHIIELCGGSSRILAELEKEGNSYTVLHSWRYRPISQKYWPLLIELSDGKVDAEMLYRHTALVKRHSTPKASETP